MKRLFNNRTIIVTLLIAFFLANFFTPLSALADEYVPVTGIVISNPIIKTGLIYVNRINVTVLPSNATNKEVTFSLFTPTPNLDININYQGYFFATTYGFTFVTVRSVDNRSIYADCAIYVIMPTSGSEVAFEWYKWNYAPVQGATNCYNYALNNQCWFPGFNTLYWMTPGELAMKGTAQLGPSVIGADGAGVIQRAQQDSGGGNTFTFNPIGRDQQCAPGTYKIALVIAPYEDFHWYRQNPDGIWSHKVGSGQVTNLDSEGFLICDPETAYRNYTSTGGYDYTYFAGYFEVSALGNMYVPY